MHQPFDAVSDPSKTSLVGGGGWQVFWLATVKLSGSRFFSVVTGSEIIVLICFVVTRDFFFFFLDEFVL